jgi:YVTN family beta-propeller protein
MLKYVLVVLIVLLILAVASAFSSIKTQIIPPTVIKNINIGPSGGLPASPDIAIAPNGRYVYATDDRLATVSVITTSNNTLVNTINVGEQDKTFPEGIVVSPDGLYIYVADSGSNIISVISSSDDKIIDNISVNDAPWWVAITPDGKYLYVAGTRDVSVISTSNNTVVGNINISTVNKIAFSLDGKYAYFANCANDNGSIWIVSTNPKNTVMNVINNVGNCPFGVAMNPNSKFLYVTTEDNITIISNTGNSVIDKIRLGSLPSGITINPDGKYVYVATTAGISIVSTSNNSVVYSINGIGSPYDAAVTPNGTEVYASYEYPSNFTPGVAVLSAPKKGATFVPLQDIIGIAAITVSVLLLVLYDALSKKRHIKKDVS